MNKAIYEKLKEVARSKNITNYGAIAPIARVEPHNPILWGILDEINRYEHREGHPMLSAVVIVQEENKPGEGFFKLARDLGMFFGSDELAFWVSELNRVWDYWSSH